MTSLGDAVRYYVGVDVGTSSVRAALVTDTGVIVSTATHPISILEPQDDFYEQSSDNIWEGCCLVVKTVCADVDKKKIRGVGFDATCSLVVLDNKLQPLSVSPTGNNHWNIIMWMDHRASDQAERINRTGHDVLKYVGGKISLEMQTPKLLWLKEKLHAECWQKAEHFFDLADFLSWRATGSYSRSLCSLVCKWTYRASADGQSGWDESYFSQIGLQDLLSNGAKKIGREVLPPGAPCGSGVTAAAAIELGLLPGTPVATSIIDAHAGGLGCLSCVPDSNHHGDFSDLSLTSKLALICGTSTCHMALSGQPLSVPGVWGPYLSAMVPDLWLIEGGQSATGKLLDHVIESHPAYSWAKDDADKRGKHIHDVLEEVLHFRAKKESVSHIDCLTKQLHVWPDYHGNRSPLADTSLKGMVCGLTLSSGMEDLALQFLATLQSLAYSSHHILRTLTDAGHSIKALVACGGLAKNKLYVQTHANATGLPIIVPDNTESVLLGAATLGACASGDVPSLQVAMTTMGGRGQVITPDQSVTEYHKKKLSVFYKMVEHQKIYQSLMASD